MSPFWKLITFDLAVRLRWNLTERRRKVWNFTTSNTFQPKFTEAEIDLFSLFFHKFSYLVLHKSSKPWNELFLIIEIFYYRKRSSVAVLRRFYANYDKNSKANSLNDKKLDEKSQRQNSGCFQQDTDPFGPVTLRRECFPYQCLLIHEKVGNSIE